MIPWGLIKFFFYLSLPWLIKRGLHLIVLTLNNAAAKKNLSSSPKELSASSNARSYYEKLSLGVCLFVIVWHLFFAFVYPSPNLFQSLNLKFNTPAFILKSSYINYFDSKARSHDRLYSEFITYKNSKDSISPEEIAEISSSSKFSSVATEYFDHIKMIDSFRNPTNRMLYLTFGDNAYRGCKFCKEASDYLFFISPIILSHYLVYFVLLGIVTSFPSKSKWINIGIVFGLVLISCEFYFHISDDPFEFSSYHFFHDNSSADRYQKIEFTRRICICISLLTLIIFDYVDESILSNNVNATKDILKSLSQSLNTLRLTKIQRTAMLNDAKLRKVWTDFYRRSESDMEILMSTPEFKSYQSKLLQKYNVEALINKALEEVDSAIKEIQTPEE